MAAEIPLLRDVKITLYDSFGYLVPGAVLLLGLGVAYWSLCRPESPLTIPTLRVEHWVALAVLASLCGHMGQAIGNVVDKAFPSAEEVLFSGKGEDSLPKAVTGKTKAEVAKVYGINADGLEAEVL
jgi:hypothetical protein